MVMCSARTNQRHTSIVQCGTARPVYSACDMYGFGFVRTSTPAEKREKHRPCWSSEAACRCAAVFTGGYTVAVIAGCGLSGLLSGVGDVSSGGAVGVGLAVGLATFAISVPAAFFMRADKAQGVKEWVSIVALAGTRKLRRTFKTTPSRLDVCIHVAFFDVFLKCALPSGALRARLRAVLERRIARCFRY